MKKILSIFTLVLLLFISMSFVLKTSKKINKNHTITAKKTSIIRSCTCNTPTGLHADRSGGTVTVGWNPVAGALRYSVGGYYSCLPNKTFSFCTTTTSVSFPSSCFVTLRVTAICDGTNCTDATCYSAPSPAVPSN